MSTVKPGEQVWDWEVLKALYMGGMEHRQIVKIPRFQGLSIKYLQNRASAEGWKGSRDEARAEGTGEIARSLISRMAEAEHDHQTWLLDTLKEERDAFDKETVKHLSGGKNQLERLQIIDKIDATVRRQLGLDDRKPLNDAQKNLGILLHMQVNPPKHKGLPSTLTVSAAIQLNEAGAISESQVQAAKLLEQYRDEEPDPLPDKPLPPGIKPLAPFKVKPILVNEKDIIDIINEPGTGFHAVEISPGRGNE